MQSANIDDVNNYAQVKQSTHAAYHPDMNYSKLDDNDSRNDTYWTDGLPNKVEQKSDQDINLLYNDQNEEFNNSRYTQASRVQTSYPQEFLEYPYHFDSKSNYYLTSKNQLVDNDYELHRA